MSKLGAKRGVLFAGEEAWVGLRAHPEVVLGWLGPLLVGLPELLAVVWHRACTKAGRRSPLPEPNRAGSARDPSHSTDLPHGQLQLSSRCRARRAPLVLFGVPRSSSSGSAPPRREPGAPGAVRHRRTRLTPDPASGAGLEPDAYGGGACGALHRTGLRARGHPGARGDHRARGAPRQPRGSARRGSRAAARAAWCGRQRLRLRRRGHRADGRAAARERRATHLRRHRAALEGPRAARVRRLRPPALECLPRTGRGHPAPANHLHPDLRRRRGPGRLPTATQRGPESERPVGHPGDPARAHFGGRDLLADPRAQRARPPGEHGRPDSHLRDPRGPHGTRAVPPLLDRGLGRLRPEGRRASDSVRLPRCVGGWRVLPPDGRRAGTLRRCRRDAAP